MICLRIEYNMVGFVQLIILVEFLQNQLYATFFHKMEFYVSPHLTL